MRSWTVAGLGLCFAVACSDGASEDVTGNWCGADVATKEQCQGDEVEYLALSQSGSGVTGVICEAYDKDCAPIDDGKLEGGTLTFTYSPQYVGGKADLKLTGDTLVGSIHTDKCGCDIPLTFHRL
jgi:hypothetical protein